MTHEETAVISGLLSLPRGVEGELSRYESHAILDHGQVRKVMVDRKTGLVTVYDGKDDLLGWTERDAKNLRQVVLANGERPAVAIEDKLFSRVVWIEGTKHKAVMMLEGLKRVFGTERLNLEHRDFQSEVKFRCAPELEVAALIVAFEIYCSGNYPAGE